MASFKDYIVELAPPWLRQLRGEQFLRGAADAWDRLSGRHKDAVKQRFIGLASPGALAELGGERGLPRAPADTDASYAARLLAAWELWQWSGTPYGVLKALDTAGYTTGYLITQQGQVHSLSAGALVTVNAGPFTFEPNLWNTFELHFSPLPAAWGGTPPPSAGVEANLIRQLVKAWKPAHARFTRIVLHLTGHVWTEPALTWGAASLTWGGTVKVWSPDNTGLWNEDPAQQWGTPGLTWGGPSLY